MSKQKQIRRVRKEKVRAILSEIVDAICAAEDKVTVALSGNTFSFLITGGTVNITVNESSTKSLDTAKKGGVL